MMYEATGRLLVTPVDKEAPTRVRRLRELGLGARAEPGLDVFADRLARVMDAPYAMVNFIDEEGQFFAGLHRTEKAPSESGTPGLGVNGVGGGADPDEPGVTAAPFRERHLARDRGYCPHVVVRRKALVLEDVRDYPRFAGNPVVDEFGVRSYLGAPLIDRTGIALGTVCVVDVEPRPWGRAGLDTVKSMAAELVDRIHRREAEGEQGAAL
ncbi:GAF domain-containing protein [Streptomyces spectabilis]|uniref:GAF domain-containing protein n=1 Tax=Streptomyces spectabilis TaxID=68270 RepID=A0A516RGI0_STRST|nr:GAF domain-containing protein [Streptomyces spectabilis]QDQ14760.1 GAF domain-containing protein [Streptomyces spectabilis]